MAEPTYTETTERLYSRLPEVYRVADPSTNYALKKYISLIADQLDEIEVLIDRIDFRTPDEGGLPTDTSDLVDPTTADAAWLTWLGQLVGVDVRGQGLTEQEQRDAIKYGSAGWRAGTKTAVADAAKTALTGTKYAVVYDHAVPSADGTTLAPGTQWDITIVTRTTETANAQAVLDAVIKKGAKPAGVVLHHLAYSATWNQIERTWSAIETLGSWTAVEEAGL